MHDLDATAAEIRWAAKSGMKGVIIPTVPGEGLPPYLDRRYDPLWAACEERAMPVHIHGGGGTPDYGSYGIASMLMYATEATFFSQRNLWILIGSGVLDRFPRFARQVTVAASFMNSHEASIRNEIGVGNLMWGADFPHVEGTWPRTRKSLARCFAGVPPEDVRAILAENPARLYGFDVAALQPIADRVGPALA